MKHILIAVLLVSTFMAEDGYAVGAYGDSVLAAKFSPILILTESTGRKWGDIRVLKPERVGIVDAQSADSIRSQKAAGRWGGTPATQIDSSTVQVDTSSSDRTLRTAKKLGIGALWGTVPSYALGALLAVMAAGNSEGFGAAFLFEFTVLFGYPLGAAAGVSRVDPYDRLIHSLAGSAVGFAVGVELTSPHDFLEDSRWETWPMYVCPLVGATIASELGRDPVESRRFTIDVVPSPGALSAAATLRF